MARIKLGVVIVTMVAAAGCAHVNTKTTDITWYEQVASQTLRVNSQCGGTYASVDEDEESVTVTIRVNRMSTNDCGGSTEVDLGSDLGDRIVVDGHDGLPVPEGQP